MEINISLDLLKIILAVFIIALHGKIFADINPEFSFFTVNGIFRIGVPIFLVITGYYFYLVKDLGKWLKRICTLYIFWMIFYSFFYFDLTLSVSAIVKNVFFFIFGYHHLWYLAGTILGGVLLFYTKNLATKIQFFLALSLFLTGVTLQYLGNFHFLFGKMDTVLNFYPLYRNFLTVCFPFLMLGFLIYKLKLNERFRSYLIPLLCLSIFILYVEAYVNYYYISKNDPLDLMFSLVLICPLTFMVFLNLNIKGTSKNLAIFSTALYLIHPLFQNVLKHYSLNSVNSFIITLILSIVTSIFLIVIHKKFKFIL